MSKILKFPEDKQKVKGRAFKSFKGEVRDSLECWFNVEILYHEYVDGHIEVWAYELEDCNISRDELIERFGRHQIEHLEEELCLEIN